MTAGVAQTGSGAGKLVAVVVTYNRLAQLEITLQRLLQSAPEVLHGVVVVNNASPDGTKDWLNSQTDPRLHIINSEKNLGGAGGFEIGVRRAVEDLDPDWIVVMDDDGRPEPGALKLFHELDLSEWDAVSAAVYFPNGEICEMNRPSRNPFWHLPVFLRTMLFGGRDGFHLGAIDYEGGARQVDISSFVGLFVSRRAIELVGYPDGGLFVYGDDGLYTLELSSKGGRIGFHPSIHFEHDCSTFAGQRGRFLPLWKTYYYHRNLLLLYRMAAGWLFWPALLVVLPKWVLKVRHHSGERGRFLSLLWLAIRHGLTRHTDVEFPDIVARAQGHDKA